MNRKFLWIILSLLLVLILVCGTVVALMFRQTMQEDNQFDTAFVDCLVSEAFDGTDKTSITVQNTGNIEAYIRVRFVTYWVNEEGQIVGIPAEMPEIPYDGAKWTELENATYFCKTAIAPGASTPNLLPQGGSITLKTDENGYRQVLEVFADAIQSKPASAVKSSWGIDPS